MSDKISYELVCQKAALQNNAIEQWCSRGQIILVRSVHPSINDWYMFVCVCLYFISMCDQWKITVPESEKVRLTFTSFDLVPDGCGDFVQVYDGSEAGSSLLGKHGVA